MSQTFRLKQSIEDAVIAGEFLPGDRLDEASLAERFGVSRTPIREALLQLGAEGFIDVRPRRGAIVSVPSPTGLFEMFETMAEIESACGRLAARRLTPESDAAMEAAHHACETAARAGVPPAAGPPASPGTAAAAPAAPVRAAVARDRRGNTGAVAWDARLVRGLDPAAGGDDQARGDGAS